MDRRQQTKAVAESLGLTDKLVGAVLKRYEDVVVDGIASGAKVHIVGLGVMSAKKTKQRVGRHPGTGNLIVIKASQKIVFVPYTRLADAAKEPGG